MPPTHVVLVEIVDRHRESRDPVTRGTLATSLGVPETTLSESLGALRECELVETTDRGYRPTETAHELLALDVDPDGVLVLDPVEE
jgi:DNA-binding IclR family transcriptional regulator